MAGMRAKPINSRAKGANAEREFSIAVAECLGVKLARNLEQSRSGGHDLEPIGDDPTAEAMRRYAIEVKRHASATDSMLGKFWKQAEAQAARAGRMPALAYRADRQGWRVCVPLRAISGDAFGNWEGIEWTATLSVDAFCALVRDGVTPGGLG